MNYYIQGDAANADQIKAAFEAKGYDTSFVQNLSASDSHILFTLPYDYRVHAFHTAYIEADILKRLVDIDPDYQELELPAEPKFKVGDWIACNADSFTLSIKSVKDENYYFHQGASLPIKDIDEHYHLWTIQDAKDGDVLINALSGTRAVIILFRGINADDSINAYCGWNEYTFRVTTNGAGYGTLSSTQYVPATKKQRDLLFAKMLEAGYEWDEKKKELCKIIQPKFKVGDKIQATIYGINRKVTIREVDKTNRCYFGTLEECIGFSEQDQWHLAPKPHYAISNFKPFDKVLARDTENEKWVASLFSNFEYGAFPHKFVCIDTCYTQCIPFEGNEHLLGTTDMCPEEYINW